MDSATRFTTSLAAVLPEELGTTPFAVAVSGGPDSMALLWLAHAALPGRVIAATVDHGLRPEAAAEARLVAAACVDLGIAHATLRPARPIAGGNLHAEARAARYALLHDWAVAAGASVLATAHHLDDQAETFLMRAVRGAGPAGLAGIRTRRALGQITLIRPLLDWRRTELAQIVSAAGMPSVADPSNADPRFERAGVRELLAGQSWLDPAGLARAAAHVGEADRALAETADWLWRTRVTFEDGAVRLNAADLPRELRRRLARRAVAHLRPAFDPGANIEPLLDALAAGRAATQSDVLVTPKGPVWHFTPAPPRR